MVQLSERNKPHAKTRKTKARLNHESNMEFAGLLKKNNIFSRIKRRFSQSEQDISTLNLEESTWNPHRNPKTISSIDDSIVDCKMITNKALSHREIDDFKAVEAYKYGPPEYSNKNKTKNPSQFFNHKYKAQRNSAVLKSAEQFEIERQIRREQVHNHYVDLESLKRGVDIESLKTRTGSDIPKMDGVLDLKNVDFNKNKFTICVSSDKKTCSESWTSSSDAEQPKYDNSAAEFDESGFDNKGKNGLSEKTVENGDLARKYEDARCISNIEENVLKSDTIVEKSMENSGDRNDLEVQRSLRNEFKSDIEQQTSGKVIENAQKTDKEGQLLEPVDAANLPQNVADNGVKSRTKASGDNSKTSCKIDDNRDGGEVWSVRDKTAKSCENLAPNSSCFESRDAISKNSLRARRLSAPSLMQIEPEEQATLDKLFKKGSKERSNSLKSALKRRSVSDTNGSSLRVRFDLRETASTDGINAKTTEEQDRSISATNFTAVKNSAINAPTKRWKYVMRKFKINKPLDDFGSYGDKVEKQVNGDSDKVDSRRQRKISGGSMSFEFATNELGAYESREHKRKDGAHDNDGKCDQAIKNQDLQKIKPSSPSWSEMSPGTEKDSSSVPLLHIAAADGDLELLKTLIKIGVDLNERDSKGWPAIHYAIRRGHFECAALLLENGVDLNCYTNNVIQEYCRTVRTVMIKKDR